jgi:1-deoxy-D-xylulose-5-phosphate synthase
MAMAGLRPVVAVYSTFFSRAFDQANLDVGLHGCRWSWSSTGPASPVTTGPATTGCSTWPWPVHPGHDRVRPLLGPRGRGHAGRGPDPRRPLGDPLPEDPGPLGGARHAWARARGPPASAPGDGSVCILAVGKMVTAAEEAALCSRPRGSTSPSGTPGGLGPRPGHGGRRRPPRGRGHRRGRGPPGWGRHVPGRRHAGRRAPRRRPPVITLGIPRAYLAQGKPDRILARLGLDGTGLARWCASGAGGAGRLGTRPAATSRQPLGA